MTAEDKKTGPINLLGPLGESSNGSRNFGQAIRTVIRGLRHSGEGDLIPPSVDQEDEMRDFVFYEEQRRLNEAKGGVHAAPYQGNTKA